MKGGLSTFALWGVLFALVPFAVDYATRKEFPVHSSGAIIITGTCVWLLDGRDLREETLCLSPLLSP